MVGIMITHTPTRTPFHPLSNQMISLVVKDRLDCIPTMLAEIILHYLQHIQSVHYVDQHRTVVVLSHPCELPHIQLFSRLQVL